VAYEQQSVFRATTRLTPFDISTIVEAYVDFREARMSLVPTTIPIRTAAALAARSEPAFRRHVLPSVVDAAGRVSTVELGSFLGRSIDPLDYLAACKSLENRRARERGYKQGNPATQEMNLKAPSDGRRPVHA
jgi:hypothetical protein